MLVFSYTMVETIDGGWGSLGADGTWGGMIGMILSDEIDIAVSDFYITQARSEVIDYTKKTVVLAYVFFSFSLLYSSKCITNTVIKTYE